MSKELHEIGPYIYNKVYIVLWVHFIDFATVFEKGAVSDTCLRDVKSFYFICGQYHDYFSFTICTRVSWLISDSSLTLTWQNVSPLSVEIGTMINMSYCYLESHI